MAYQYKHHRRNHLILPGRERALEEFLNQTHEGVRHKQAHKRNPNSEDALTWSCFEMLASLPALRRRAVLAEVFEDAYAGREAPIFGDGDDDADGDGLNDGEPAIHIGKTYAGRTCGESTEVDASIESRGALVFFEAKLYSSMSMATDAKRDQIARKLRVGVDAPLGDARAFFFIFLDIAPLEHLRALRRGAELGGGSGFTDKWKSAHIFAQYKRGENLDDALAGIPSPSAQAVARRMGWLTWGSLFKSILRGMV
ncbi:MAG: hypothetical protein ACR2P7_00455 [bacterium]